MCLSEYAVWTYILLFCSQFSGTGGGDRLHVAGHGWQEDRGGKAGGHQRERRPAGIFRDAWGRRQLPLGGNPLKTRALSGIWNKKNVSNLPEKGNTTKLECSTTDTVKANIVFTLSTQQGFAILLVFLLHLVPLELHNVYISGIRSCIYWKLPQYKTHCRIILESFQVL